MSGNEKFSAIRKGLLEFLILKIISADELYVADMLQRLSTTEFATQEGTLYPLLSKLRRDGLVDYVWEEPRPDRRAYYRLTPKGTSAARRAERLLEVHQRHDQPARKIGMQKVVTINLNGHAYQLDEAAYDAARLPPTGGDPAERQSRSGEIFADLERAIAEKCDRFLGPQKTVVGAAEMDQVVTEMGPVEGTDGTSDGAAAGGAAAGKQSAGRATPRRLYRIREGQMIGGVCNGLAAYFGVDPTLVRVPFLLLLWIGIGGLAYIALMVVIPYADTPAEQAAASGQPFNAQELIDSIKRHAADFKDHGKWTEQWRAQKGQWRQQKRQWRAEHRAWRQQWRHTMEAQRWWAGSARRSYRGRGPVC
jgi:PadR family transcriptional regulator PadR